MLLRETWFLEKKEIRLSLMTKTHIPTEKLKKQRDNTTTVWLNRFTGSKPSHELQKLCNQKDTHLKICQ